MLLVLRDGAARECCGFCGDHLGSCTLGGAEGLACLVGFWSLAIVLFDIGMYDEGICGRLFCLDRRNGMFAYRASRVWFGVSWTGFDDEVVSFTV